VYGSQGEQRLALLALLLSEADVITAGRGEPPLLLLDDVLSELDEERRVAFLTGLPARGQTLVTATTLRSLPRDGRQP
jgi:DNA replication and repair protein RecF